MWRTFPGQTNQNHCPLVAYSFIANKVVMLEIGRNISNEDGQPAFSGFLDPAIPDIEWASLSVSISEMELT
jgi:hypothetical protein